MKKGSGERQDRPEPFPFAEGPVTLKEAAAMLGTTPDNLRGAIARGSLKAVKVGRDWHVTSLAVDLYRHQHLRSEAKEHPRRRLPSPD